MVWPNNFNQLLWKVLQIKPCQDLKTGTFTIIHWALYLSHPQKQEGAAFFPRGELGQGRNLMGQGKAGWCRAKEEIFGVWRGRVKNAQIDILSLQKTIRYRINLHMTRFQLREGCRKSKWKFKMAFAMKGGVSRGSRVPYTYFEKWFLLKTNLEPIIRGLKSDIFEV